LTAHVLVQPLGVAFELEVGETLMSAATRAGYYWPTICKGNAQCNRCAVRVIDGAGLEPYSAVELTGLRNVRWRNGVEDHADRLACQLRAFGDAVVEKRGVKPIVDVAAPGPSGDPEITPPSTQHMNEASP
jgi:2Fe-2S ferredoxin